MIEWKVFLLCTSVNIEAAHKKDIYKNKDNVIKENNNKNYNNKWQNKEPGKSMSILL